MLISHFSPLTPPSNAINFFRDFPILFKDFPPNFLLFIV